MPASLQEQYDDAMFDFSMADYPSAIAKLKSILDGDPNYFDALLSLGMAYCRMGDYPAAIAIGHQAEALHPNEQLVHTNLSLFYMKSGDKTRAEHHGLQAKLASWKGNMAPPGETPAGNPELDLAKPAPAPVKISGKAQFPDMPWKNH